MLPSPAGPRLLVDLELLTWPLFSKERRRLCVFLLAVVRCPSWDRPLGTGHQAVSFLEKRKRLNLSENRRGKLELPLPSLVSGVSGHHHVNVTWRLLWFGFSFWIFKIAHFFLIAVDWWRRKQDLLAHCHPHSCKGSQPSCSSENIPPPFFLPSQYLGHY